MMPPPFKKMTELCSATAGSRDDSLRNSKKAHLSKKEKMEEKMLFACAWVGSLLVSVEVKTL